MNAPGTELIGFDYLVVRYDGTTEEWISITTIQAAYFVKSPPSDDRDASRRQLSFDQQLPQLLPPIPARWRRRNLNRPDNPSSHRFNCHAKLMCHKRQSFFFPWSFSYLLISSNQLVQNTTILDFLDTPKHFDIPQINRNIYDNITENGRSHLSKNCPLPPNN